MKSKLVKKAFTLVEILVVIAIIGTLATIVFVSYNSAQAKARDSRRLQDLSTISGAGLMYYNYNKTFLISGYGYIFGGVGTGNGFFNHSGGDYAESVNQGFIDGGYLTGIVIDPTDPNGEVTNCSATIPGRCYMYFGTGSKLSVYAFLEKTSQTESEQLNWANPDYRQTPYVMNYAITVTP